MKPGEFYGGFRTWENRWLMVNIELMMVNNWLIMVNTW